MKHASKRDPAVSRPLSEIKAELFKALAHPGRVRILEVLRDGDHTVAGRVRGIDFPGGAFADEIFLLGGGMRAIKFIIEIRGEAGVQDEIGEINSSTAQFEERLPGEGAAG